MSIRQHPTKGPGWWYIGIGWGKGQQNYPFQGTKEQALQYEQEIRKLVTPGPPKANPRFNEVLADYVRDYEMHHLPGGAERQKRSLALLKKFFGHHNLLSITPPHIEQYKRQRLDAGVKPTTIQKELAALSGLLHWAEEHDLIDNIPKIKRFPLKMIKAPTPKVPQLSQVEKILAELPENLRPIFQLQAWCGLRSEEARTLTAGHIIADRRLIIVIGKGGKQRIVPVPDDELWSSIENRLTTATADEYLWPNPETGEPYRDLRGSLKAAAKRAGYNEHMTPHLFRHAYGTELIGSGVATLRDVQVLLGHSTSQITEIYTHLSTSRLTTVTDALRKKNL